jgi:archaellum component FlaF (FlaF/FlaG flagellin family)
MPLGKINNFHEIYIITNLKAMATVDNIRNGLIDKILSINNKEFLKALDKLIISSSSDSKLVNLTDEQKVMLEMSENDIKSGNLISQKAMNQRNLEWLNSI